MKYYIRGKIDFVTCEESDVGLYVGDDIVLILPHNGSKFRIQFSNNSELITDMVTPINLFVDGNLVEKRSDKRFLVSKHQIGDEILYRLRSRKDGSLSLTVKKDNRNKREFYIDENNNWYLPPNYNMVLGYIDE